MIKQQLFSILPPKSLQDLRRVAFSGADPVQLQNTIETMKQEQIRLKADQERALNDAIQKQQSLYQTLQTKYTTLVEDYRKLNDKFLQNRTTSDAQVAQLQDAANKSIAELERVRTALAQVGVNITNKTPEDIVQIFANLPPSPVTQDLIARNQKQLAQYQADITKYQQQISNLNGQVAQQV